MSEGSLRLTIRVGQSMRTEIEKAVARHNKQPGGIIEWTVTDFVLAAVCDKLNHGERSRRTKRKIKVITEDHNGTPRKRLEWTEADVKRPFPDPEEVTVGKLLDAVREV